jgi:hypothetical protein
MIKINSKSCYLKFFFLLLTVFLLSPLSNGLAEEQESVMVEEQGVEVTNGTVQDFLTTNVLITDSMYAYTNPSMAIDSDGVVYMACQRKSSGLERIRIYRSLDGGMTWTNLGSFYITGGDCLNPSIAVGGDYLFIAYEDTSTTPSQLRVNKRLKNGASSTHKILDKHANYNYHNPYIFTDAYDYPSDYYVYLLAEEELNTTPTNQNIAFWKTEDWGENWTNVSRVRGWGDTRTWVNPHGSWGDDGGYLYTVCYNENDKTIYLDRSDDEGNSFSFNTTVYTLPRDPNQPTLPQVAAATPSTNSNVMVVFTYPADSSGNDHIRYIYSKDNCNSWFTWGYLASSSDAEYAPCLHANESGGSWHAIWFNDDDNVIRHRSRPQDLSAMWGTTTTLNSIFPGAQNGLSSFWDSDDAAIVSRDYNSDDIYFNREDTGYSLTVTSPNGGESWAIGSTQDITWDTHGIITEVKLLYTTDSGSNWILIEDNVANTGTYEWTVPNTPSTQCKVRIVNANGTEADKSDAKFSIVSTVTGTLTITSPNGGETWNVGSVYNITWTSTGSPGNVKLEYTTNNGGTWILFDANALNDGVRPWTVPNTPSTNCKVRITSTSNPSITDASDSVFTIVSAPTQIALNRTQFYYGATTAGPTTQAQNLIITNSGGGTLSWVISPNQSWLSCTPSSGSGTGLVSVSVNASGQSVGTYTGTLTVTATGATNSPQTVNITLKVYTPAQAALPFGTYETPADGATVAGSIPVTGWALDDVGPASVKLYRKSGATRTYIGDAIFVEGARPDVEAAYPGYPLNYQAGWGYMMLTNFLPNSGNGTFIIEAAVTDQEGREVSLGTKTIICDNANAVKPFGAIDTPAQGGTASGSSFVNWGWALTPMPNSIPTDGSTIDVWVDGVNLGNPTYNNYRADIATKFPGYANSNGAIGYFYIDTTTYSTGTHSIQWVAEDSASNTDGIGSRYFNIINTGPDVSAQANIGGLIGIEASQVSAIPFDVSTPLAVSIGYNDYLVPRQVFPDESGTTKIRVKELDRVKIKLSREVAFMNGYQLVNNQLRPLPPGFTLDAKNSTILWQMGVGFKGNYDYLFLITTSDGQRIKKRVTIQVSAKDNCPSSGKHKK